MTFTGDNGPPTKSPFTDAWQTWITELAADVSKMGKYLPMFDSMFDTYPGAGGGGGNIFPAVIISDSGLGGNYEFVETETPHSIEALLDGRENVAKNMLEVGISTGQSSFYIPPGFTNQCFEDVFPNSFEMFWQALPINVGTLVMMMEVANPDPNPTDPDTEHLYAFSITVPICISCGSGG